MWCVSTPAPRVRLAKMRQTRKPTVAPSPAMRMTFKLRPNSIVRMGPPTLTPSPGAEEASQMV